MKSSCKRANPRGATHFPAVAGSGRGCLASGILAVGTEGLVQNEPLNRALTPPTGQALLYGWKFKWHLLYSIQVCRRAFLEQMKYFLLFLFFFSSPFSLKTKKAKARSAVTGKSQSKDTSIASGSRSEFWAISLQQVKVAHSQQDLYLHKQHPVDFLLSP